MSQDPALEELASIIRATAILSPTRFAVAGELSPSLAPRVEEAMSPETTRQFLVYQLQQKLYDRFFCGMRNRAVPVRSPAMDSEFVQALSRANSGRGQWEPGWEVREADSPGHFAVFKNGLTLWVRAEDLRPEDGVAAVGSKACVRFGKERRGLYPGFYMAVGDEPMDTREGESGDHVLRFYWHVQVQGAATLMSLVTGTLNQRGIAFQFKIANSPLFINRRDAAVLYLRKTDLGQATEIVSAIYQQVAPQLNGGVPLFTKKLGPGLGFAIDPGNGESFGQHRMRILAESLRLAHDQGCTSTEQKLATVIQYFENSGIDLRRPYLTPDCADLEDMEVPA